MVRWFVLPLALLMIAGCMGSPKPADAREAATTTAPPVCPTASDALVAYQALEAFGESPPTTPISLRMEGTIEGDVGSMVISADPARKAMLLTGTLAGEEVEMRLVHPYYSMETSEGGFQARDHEPMASEDLWSFLGDDEDDPTGSLSFADDLAFEDYAARCTIQGGRDAIEFSYSDSDRLETMVVERFGEHRILSGRMRDNVTKDDFRISASYDQVDIRVDGDLPKKPIDLEMRLIHQTPVQGALVTRVSFTEGTEWAPLTELDLAIVGADDYDLGQLYSRYRLQAGTFAMDEGEFEFVDGDANGLLSAGDVLEVTVLDGYDFQVYDIWAEDYSAFTMA